jgi:3-hydroxyisobutyrate dehydrogenase-like beta-hydroxyacid dehydrogenase
MAFCNAAAAAEGMMLGVTAGLDPHKLIQVISSSSGNSATFKPFSERALSGQFTPPSFALNLAHKDLHLALELADELDVPLPQGSATHNLQRMARKMGLGGADSSAILKVYETVLGKTVKP